MQTQAKPMKALFVSTLLLITVFSALLFLTPIGAADPTLSYQVHVSNTGWMDPVGDAATAGTPGANQVEALKISASLPENSSLSYQSHVQNYGWLDWITDDGESGTTGEGLRLEAFRIRLGGTAAETYDIYYRAFVQDKGWLGWAKNGADAGSTGMEKAVQAIEIRLIPKNDPAPGSTQNPVLSGNTHATTSASEHIEGIGWTSGSLTNRVIGTTGEARRLEALMLDYHDDASSAIEYMSHISDIGWESGWHRNGEVSGTTGQSKQLECVRIRLSGPAAEKNDVYYRAHSQDRGWLDWKKNGEDAGTTGEGLRLEALQIKILPKTSASEAEAIGTEAFKARIYGCWIDSVRADEPVNSYVSGISESYLYLGNNQTFNGYEGSYELINPTTEGGWITMTEIGTGQTHDIYLDFNELPGNHLRISENGSGRELILGDTTDRIHYTFSGLLQYGQSAVLELRKGPNR